jgi:hypothetical protein
MQWSVGLFTMVSATDWAESGPLEVASLCIYRCRRQGCGCNFQGTLELSPGFRVHKEALKLSCVVSAVSILFTCMLDCFSGALGTATGVR